MILLIKYEIISITKLNYFTNINICKILQGLLYTFLHVLRSPNVLNFYILHWFGHFVFTKTPGQLLIHPGNYRTYLQMHI